MSRPIEGDPGKSIPRFTFRDSLMKYEFYLHQSEHGESVFLAADPVQPIQGLPFFEISLPCTRIAPLPRNGMPVGIGFFAGPDWASLRFSITRREDGNISLSGAWNGLTLPHPVNPPIR